jgi:hypothetical protein
VNREIVTQQPYAPYPPQGAPQPQQYQQSQYPAPPAPQGYAPPAPGGYPPATAPAPAYGVPGVATDADLDMSGPAFAKLGDYDGRLIYILPKKFKPATDPRYGDQIECDVVLFDGAPITHTVEDGTAKPLAKPVNPGELVENMFVGQTRIVPALKPWIGKGQGFVRRVGKDGRAIILIPVSPQESEWVAGQIADVYSRAQAAAATANPIAQAAQRAAAAPAPAGGGMQQPQYGQQFAVPNYGAGAPPVAAQQAPQAAPPAPQPPTAPAPQQAFDPNQWAAQQTGQPQG